MFLKFLTRLSDLASNWDIDIASELDDYLEDIGQIIIGDQDENPLNFAQGNASTAFKTYTRNTTY